MYIALVTTWRSNIAFYSGDWRHARQDGEQALALCRQIGPFFVAPSPCFSLGQVSYGEGRWGEAARYLEESVALAERAGIEVAALLRAQNLLAELELRSGRPAAALARLVPLLERPNLGEVDVASLLPNLAWAHLELGDLGQAAMVATQALTRMRAKNDRLELVDALRVQALIAMWQGTWDEAAQALEEGVALARSMPYPFAEARLLHVYGQMHIQKGEPDRARERLEAALAIFQRLGARKDVERVEQAAAALQRRDGGDQGDAPCWNRTR